VAKLIWRQDGDAVVGIQHKKGVSEREERDDEARK
jgi:hypothetical protein